MKKVSGKKEIENTDFNTGLLQCNSRNSRTQKLSESLSDFVIQRMQYYRPILQMTRVRSFAPVIG